MQLGHFTSNNMDENLNNPSFNTLGLTISSAGVGGDKMKKQTKPGMNKRGQGLEAVPGIMVTVLAVVLVIFFTAKFITTTQAGETAGTLAYNATVGGTDVIKNVTSNMGMWGLAIGIGVTLAIVLGAIYFATKNR